MAHFSAWTNPAAKRMIVDSLFSAHTQPTSTTEGFGNGVQNWKIGKLLTNCHNTQNEPPP